MSGITVSLKPKSARLEHPTVAGVAVVVRRLTNTQRFAIQMQAMQALRHVLEATRKAAEAQALAVDGAEPEPVEALADQAALNDVSSMIASISATMKAALMGVEGLVDEDGAPVVLSPANTDAVIDALWGGQFIVPDVETLVVDAKDPQKTSRKKANIQFPIWLSNKVADPATFGPPADISPKESQPQ